MKFASFEINGAKTWGLIDGNEAVDLGAVLRDRFPDLKSAIAAGALSEAAKAAAKAARHPLASLAWLPVIPNPDKILCIGLNYENHRKETGRTEVENPTVFGRFANSQTGHLTNIIRPKVSTDLDYEGELALIIGKPGRYISKKDSWGHIAGYACYNEGSVRDYQRHTHQYTPGKNFPNTGAFGPWMVTPDEAGDLRRRHVRRAHDAYESQPRFADDGSRDGSRRLQLHRMLERMRGILRRRVRR